MDPHQSFSGGVAWWLVPDSHLAGNLNLSGIHFSLSPVVVTIINCCAKLNEPLIQSVGHGIYTLSHNHLCLPIAPLQVHNITLQESIFLNLVLSPHYTICQASSCLPFIS